MGVSITSIPEQTNARELNAQCRDFHSKPNCAKPSQDPKVTGKRDAQWLKKKPELFFDSRRHLARAQDFQRTALKEREVAAAAAAGGTSPRGSGGGGSSSSAGAAADQRASLGIEVDGDKINKQPVSLVGRACAGGSTYVELIVKQMGYDN